MAPATLTITPRLRRQLGDWLQEDLGRGDLTAPALQARRGQAHWVAKADGVFCGGVLIEPLLRELQPPDGGCRLHRLVADGAGVCAGDRLVELEGPASVLVALERTALNLAMRLSGIASATAALVAKLEGTGVVLADTRKTTPGLRELEKYAVRCGGGVNHRMGLDDAAMLKENLPAEAALKDTSVRSPTKKLHPSRGRHDRTFFNLNLAPLPAVAARYRHATDPAPSTRTPRRSWSASFGRR